MDPRISAVQCKGTGRQYSNSKVPLLAWRNSKPTYLEHSTLLHSTSPHLGPPKPDDTIVRHPAPKPHQRKPSAVSELHPLTKQQLVHLTQVLPTLLAAQSALVAAEQPPLPLPLEACTVLPVVRLSVSNCK